MILLTRTRRLDWARMIEHLRADGMTLTEIAAQLDVQRQSLDGYIDDRCVEPAFWVGARLMTLWSERMQLPWIQAPVRDVPESVSRVLKATA